MKPTDRRLPWLVLAASLIICFGVWRWAEHVLVPSNTANAQNKGIPIGNNSDLYPRWLGTRELLLHNRDPYSAEVTREIQIGFYGRPLDPNNPADPKDQAAFAYPLYVVFLLAPTAHLPFPTVEKIFQWLALTCIAVSVPLWMYAVGFRTNRTFVISGMVLAISTSAAISEFYKQNLAAMVILFLAASAATAVRGWLVLGGFFLALSTIKPQLSGFFIVFFILWATGRWTERQRLFWSFTATLLALFAATEAVSPRWVGRFLAALRQYETYAGDPSILSVLLPSWLAWIFSGALVCVLLFLWWKWRRFPAGSDYYGWALTWAAAVTLATIHKLAAYNQPLLIPALLVLLARRKQIFQSGLVPRALVKAAFACPVWQWGTAVGISLCTLFVPTNRLLPAAGIPQYTLLALPALTLLAVVAATIAIGRLRAPIPATTTSENLAGPHE